MSLHPGTGIGPYTVATKLGEGGMGVVYRARDTRLQRDVAIKILPEIFASAPERLARFEREAQVLAALNHPHIAQIYGVEDSGEGRALVMEFVDGETLADRIARGPLPVHDVLPIAAQIAEALEAAHEQGIVHRDLKPANIKLRPDGTVKVLDFGLAKFPAPAVAPAASQTLSPTITSPSLATGVGVLLGTAAYMSPEQARGKAADRRADIWAFGCVVYEMLSGRRAFDGEDVSLTLSMILQRDPDFAALPPAVPANVRQTLRVCLRKDPRDRASDIRDVRLALDGAFDSQTAATPSLAAPPPSRPWLAWAIAAAGLLFALAAAYGWWRASVPPDRPFMRFTDDVGEPLIVTSFGPAVAMSPDGLRVAMVTAAGDGRTHLVLRSLGSPVATPLAGTDDAVAPFFSPDGRTVGFFAGATLRRVSVDGGAATTVANLATAAPRGAAWGEDGQIVFAEQLSGLMRVPASGGPATAVTQLRPGEVTHRFPQLLPGAKAVIFTASHDNNTWGSASVDVQALDTGERKTLVTNGYFGRYVQAADGSGYLLYVRERTVLAAPLDVARLELSGPGVAVLEDVMLLDQNGFAQMDVAGSRAVVYVPGSARDGRALAQFDAAGHLELLSTPRAAFAGAPVPSPDGTRVAIRTTDTQGTNLSLIELTANRLVRLTFVKGGVGDPPVWSPDGRHIVFAFSGTELAGPGLYWVRTDGAGEPQRLLDDSAARPSSFSPDGRRLAYVTSPNATGHDHTISILPLDMSNAERPKPGRPEIFLRSRTTLENPNFSPDGRWIAYSSAEVQPPQIFVRPSSPGRGDAGRWQISSDGGRMVQWSTNTRQLAFGSPGRPISFVPYTSDGESFQARQPVQWTVPPQTFTAPPRLMPDGKHFIASVSAVDDAVLRPTHVAFLVNFADELGRRFREVER